MIDRIDRQLREWFQWAEETVSGGLGYPGSYELGHPRSDKHGPIHPERLPPAELRPIHFAIRVMPENLWTVLTWRYGQPGRQKDQAKQIGVSKSTYEKTISFSHYWLSGYIENTQIRPDLRVEGVRQAR